MTNSLNKLANPIEAKIARKVVTLALAKGYMISVYDGKAMALMQSTSRNAILDAMASTDEDHLFFRNAAGDRVGHMLLIYGNGEDLISDYTDNDAMADLADEATFGTMIHPV
jgi:hypothetical protein